MVEPDEIVLDYSNSVCFSCVTFPSRDGTREGEEELWYFDVYTTLTDGSVTRTVLGVSKPLQAGQLEIIRVRALNNGAVYPDDSVDSYVGASVTLN